MPLPIDLSATVSMAWHLRATSEPALAWFRELLIEAASDLCGIIVASVAQARSPLKYPSDGKQLIVSKTQWRA